MEWTAWVGKMRGKMGCGGSKQERGAAWAEWEIKRWRKHAECKKYLEIFLGV